MARRVKPSSPIIAMNILFDGSGNEEANDYRAVPASDNGVGYSDRGMLGSYATPESSFRTPKGVKQETGFGANMEDLDRGYVKPTMREDPAYDLQNYKDRSTLPSATDEDFYNTASFERDYQFRNQGRRSKGFLTRPKLSTER